MEDFDGKGLVPTRDLAKQGVAAVGYIAGGALVFVLGALPGPIGLVGGAVLGGLGLAGLFSKDPEDKKPGLFAALGGGLVVLTKLRVLPGIASLGLSFLGVGCMIRGIWEGIKFLRGLKSRS